MPQVPHAQLATTQISVINESTVLTDAEVTPVVIALQQQVTNDFRPVWGIDAELKMIPQGSPAPAGTWWLVVLDDSDQAGALGYHDLTPDGLPMGKVFAASDLKAGTSWSVTASHELLEMLADPNINLTVFVQNANTTRHALRLRSVRRLRRRPLRLPDQQRAGLGLCVSGMVREFSDTREPSSIA